MKKDNYIKFCKFIVGKPFTFHKEINNDYYKEINAIDNKVIITNAVFTKGISTKIFYLVASSKPEIRGCYSINNDLNKILFYYFEIKIEKINFIKEKEFHAFLKKQFIDNTFEIIK